MKDQTIFEFMFLLNCFYPILRVWNSLFPCACRERGEVWGGVRDSLTSWERLGHSIILETGAGQTYFWTRFTSIKPPVHLVFHATQSSIGNLGSVLPYKHCDCSNSGQLTYDIWEIDLLVDVWRATDLGTCLSSDIDKYKYWTGILIYYRLEYDWRLMTAFSGLISSTYHLAFEADISVII